MIFLRKIRNSTTSGTEITTTAAIMAEAEKRYAEGTLVEVTELTEMSGGY